VKKKDLGIKDCQMKAGSLITMIADILERIPDM
jgi:hypothetical protein